MDEAVSNGSDHTFELSGGALCLDFANTWGDRERSEQDHLRGYGDLLAFAFQAGVLDAAQRSVLELRARRDEEGAKAAFVSARALRDAIYRLFSSVAAGASPSEEDLDRLNRALPDALAGLRIEPVDGDGAGFVWSRAGGVDSLEAPLWPTVRSAAELLTSGTLGRVRECDGASCTWLFLDQSRNRSRRWCSMETCGNRAKVRRHYRRSRPE